MDLDQHVAALSDLPLGGVRYFPQAGSTNDLAMDWANQGAKDLSLIVADEQTAGRGRNGRTWYSQPGTSLTFSLIVKPTLLEHRSIGLFTALAALAVVQAVRSLPGKMDTKIKWPNDVLVNQHKVCGILTETTWIGDRVEQLVIGVGINVCKGSVPSGEILNFPASSLEELAHSQIDRMVLLHSVLLGFLFWRQHLGKRSFLDAWESSLAFMGEQVKIWSLHGSAQLGTIIGLEENGNLLLKDALGNKFSVSDGELHLDHLGQ